MLLFAVAMRRQDYIRPCLTSLLSLLNSYYGGIAVAVAKVCIRDIHTCSVYHVLLCLWRQLALASPVLVIRVVGGLDLLFWITGSQGLCAPVWPRCRLQRSRSRARRRWQHQGVRCV